MIRIFVACCLLWLLFLSTGCTVSKQPSRPPETAVSPQPTVADNKSENPPPSSPLKYAPAYVDKEPKAKVPADARHSKQRIIAVFQHDSNICVINGREMLMEGKATVTKHDSSVPFKYIAAALGVPEGYTFNPKTESITLRSGEKSYRFDGRLGDDGVLYTSIPRNMTGMGYDILWDHHSGRLEILDPLPLTADDFIIDELYMNMSFDEVISLFGLADNQSLSHNHLYYSGFTFDRGFLSESVETIVVRSDIFATRRGIRVGDSLSKVIELYGRGYSRGIGYNNPDILEYYFPKEICKYGYLSFEIDEFARVKEIVLSGIPASHYPVAR